MQVIGTADEAWGSFAYEFKKMLKELIYLLVYGIPVAPTAGRGPGHYRVKYQIGDFLKTYGALDTIHYGLPGAQFDLSAMESYFTWQGVDGGMTLSVDGGGAIEGTTFVDDGKPGMSKVTATSNKDPSIVRHAYIAIGVRQWAEDATTTGAWKEKDYQGHTLKVALKPMPVSPSL